MILKQEERLICNGFILSTFELICERVFSVISLQPYFWKSAQYLKNAFIHINAGRDRDSGIKQERNSDSHPSHPTKCLNYFPMELSENQKIGQAAKYYFLFLSLDCPVGL